MTANGDTHGLFVATKTLGGFIVRESQGGRSTVTFDYRIMATAAGQTGQRMAVISGVAFGGNAPNALTANVPAVSPLVAPALPATP